jgi:hypothetical protein
MVSSEIVVNIKDTHLYKELLKENMKLKENLKEINSICNCQGDCDGCKGCIGLIELEVDKALKGGE